MGNRLGLQLSVRGLSVNMARLLYTLHCFFSTRFLLSLAKTLVGLRKGMTKKTLDSSSRCFLLTGFFIIRMIPIRGEEFSLNSGIFCFSDKLLNPTVP